MSVDIKLPNITASDPKGQLEQVRRYLYGLAEQLNFALGTLEKGVAGNEQIVKEGTNATLTEKEAQNNFNAIKSLIIKSADIVNAYYDEVSRRLEGQYVAQSEFGTYTENTERLIEENSTSIENIFTNLQTIESTLSEIDSALIDVTANIKTGLLYYDDNGVPIYGMEIGQRNMVDGVETFNKYARFVSDRLSFYDKNNIEVAYISDYKLYITNVEVTGDLKVGGTVYLPGCIIDTSDGFAILPII